ncbi:Conidiation protein 6-domain-containing protein [Fomes fomentarius]|nr:Conidiation protein 6-domain-containing protein [Fomes fomentarius]
MSSAHESRVAAGLKAAINNPNVSEDAKERAQERLEDMNTNTSYAASGPGGYDATGHETNRVLGGYKATLHNPNTSAEAKEHAREVLEGESYSGGGGQEDLHQTRVNAGYKAALHNPNVSSEAKEHAKEYLDEQGEL